MPDLTNPAAVQQIKDARANKMGQLTPRPKTVVRVTAGPMAQGSGIRIVKGYVGSGEDFEGYGGKKHRHISPPSNGNIFRHLAEDHGWDEGDFNRVSDAEPTERTGDFARTLQRHHTNEHPSQANGFHVRKPGPADCVHRGGTAPCEHASAPDSTHMHTRLDQTTFVHDHPHDPYEHGIEDHDGPTPLSARRLARKRNEVPDELPDDIKNMKLDKSNFPADHDNCHYDTCADCENTVHACTVNRGWSHQYARGQDHLHQASPAFGNHAEGEWCQGCNDAVMDNNAPNKLTAEQARFHGDSVPDQLPSDIRDRKLDKSAADECSWCQQGRESGFDATEKMAAKHGEGVTPGEFAEKAVKHGTHSGLVSPQGKIYAKQGYARHGSICNEAKVEHAYGALMRKHGWARLTGPDDGGRGSHVGIEIKHNLGSRARDAVSDVAMYTEAHGGRVEWDCSHPDGSYHSGNDHNSLAHHLSRLQNSFAKSRGVEALERITPKDFVTDPHHGAFVHPSGSLHRFPAWQTHEEALRDAKAIEGGAFRAGIMDNEHGRPQFFVDAYHSATPQQHATIRGVARRGQREGHDFHWRCMDHETDGMGVDSYEKHFAEGLKKGRGLWLRTQAKGFEGRPMSLRRTKRGLAFRKSTTWIGGMGRHNCGYCDKKATYIGQHPYTGNGVFFCNQHNKDYGYSFHSKTGEQIRAEKVAPTRGQRLYDSMTRLANDPAVQPGERANALAMRDRAKTLKSMRLVVLVKSMSDVRSIKRFTANHVKPEHWDAADNWLHGAKQTIEERTGGTPIHHQGVQIGHAATSEHVAQGLAAMSPRMGWGTGAFAFDKVHGREMVGDKNNRGIALGNSVRRARTAIRGGGMGSGRSGKKTRALADLTSGGSSLPIDVHADRVVHYGRKPDHQAGYVAGKRHDEHAAAFHEAATDLGHEPRRHFVAAWLAARDWKEKKGNTGIRAARSNEDSAGQPNVLRYAKLWPGQKGDPRLLMNSKAIWQSPASLEKGAGRSLLPAESDTIITMTAKPQEAGFNG